MPGGSEVPIRIQQFVLSYLSLSICCIWWKMLGFSCSHVMAACFETRSLGCYHDLYCWSVAASTDSWVQEGRDRARAYDLRSGTASTKNRSGWWFHPELRDDWEAPIVVQIWLVISPRFFIFTPNYLGKMNAFWLIFFQMGWFNHQPVKVLKMVETDSYHPLWN